MVFLSAMHEDPEQRGMCHVQTAQLDGETNLKLRHAPAETLSLFESDGACAGFRGSIECEQPTEHFGKFTGKLMRDDGDRLGCMLEANNTLLRGCVLRNVEYVYGLVVYTGDETKVRVKQREVRSKRPTVEHVINRFIWALLVAVMIVCIVGTCAWSLLRCLSGYSVVSLSRRMQARLCTPCLPMGS